MKNNDNILFNMHKRMKSSRVWNLSRSDRISFLIGVGIVSVILVTAIFADFLAPYDPLEIHADSVHSPPGSSIDFMLGTDALGRDLLSRIIYGTRVSLLVGLTAVLISSVIGATLGVLTGYFGGTLDRLITLPMDALYSFPAFLTALLIVTSMGTSTFYLSLAVAFGLLPKIYRTVRSAAVAIKEEEFIEAEVSIGATDLYIVFRHIYPLCSNVLVVVMTISIATAILSIAGLGFLGLGVPTPTPEWGTDLASGRPNILSGVWWTTMVPAAFIFLTVLGFNLLGEGLNKIFGATLEEI
ncbi:MAG: ABC transporter permease [Candidatus Hodarchaeales archaeon]|jgi:ABC-type dipeptide/oligopeptide/nickel transport system permease subunit